MATPLGNKKGHLCWWRDPAKEGLRQFQVMRCVFAEGLAWDSLRIALSGLWPSFKNFPAFK